MSNNRDNGWPAAWRSSPAAPKGSASASPQRLAEEGASVVLADIKIDAAEAAAERIIAAGGKAAAIPVDIGEDASVRGPGDASRKPPWPLRNPRQQCRDRRRHPYRDHDDGAISRVISINQDGAIRMTMAFVPLIKKGGAGRRILNIASIQGLRGWPNQLAYATAKGAIVNFTRALACRTRALRHHGQCDRAGLRRHAHVDPARWLA